MQTTNIFSHRPRLTSLQVITLLFFICIICTSNLRAANFDRGYFRYRILPGDFNVEVDWLIEAKLDEHPVSRLEIPPTVEYNGEVYTVRSISNHAWIIQNNIVTSIKLPETLTEISPSIPWARKDLKEIIMDEANPYFTSLEGILYNKDLSKLILCPPGLEEVEVAEGVAAIGPYAFKDGLLHSIKLPEGLNSIESDAFLNCRNLESVEFPSTLSEVSYRAFGGCGSLKRVSIPASLKKIYPTAFKLCHNLTDFSVDNDNPYMTAEGPMLFNKDKTELLQFPSAVGDVIVPDGVKKTDSYLFAYNNEITSVTFPASLEAFHVYPFFSCDEIKWIKLYSPTPPEIIGVYYMGNGFITESEYPDWDNFHVVIYIPAESEELYRNAEAWWRRNLVPFDAGSGMSGVMEEDSWEVYTVNGLHILTTSNYEEINSLPAGFYIINGKKILKNR